MAPKNNKNEKTREDGAVNNAPADKAVEEIVKTAPAADATEDAGQEAKKQFAYMRELVDVTPAPPRAGEDPNYPIGINGKLWLLPKGKTSKVPRYVAMAFNQAEAAKGTQRDSQANLLERQSGSSIDLASMTESQIAQLKNMLGL